MKPSLLIVVGLIAWLGGNSHAAEVSQWQKLVEAANQEGQVAVYGGQEISHPDIIAAFNKAYPGIKVLATTGRGSELMNRVIAERRADKYLVDIMASGPNGPRTLYLAKALDPIVPALLQADVIDPSKWYGGKHWFADPENRYIFMFEGTTVSSSLSYNTTLANPEEIKSYWDLLAPKWKGKLLSMDPRGTAPTPLLILYHNSEVGEAFIRKFYTETGMAFFRDRRQGTNWLATGKFAVCFMCRDIEKVNKQGLPVDTIMPEGVKEADGIGGGGSSVIALVNKAPHPNAAKVFLNWYLSRQGQMVWQNVMNKKEVEASDSMRIDIPKDDVLPEARRAPGKKYKVVGFVDPEPVQKLLQAILK